MEPGAQLSLIPGGNKVESFVVSFCKRDDWKEGRRRERRVDHDVQGTEGGFKKDRASMSHPWSLNRFWGQFCSKPLIEKHDGSGRIM